jgi:peptide chain release factor 1
MLDKLKALEEKYEKVAALMADPAVAGDPSKYREHAKSYSELAPVVAKYREYGRALKELDQAKALVRETEDEGMRELAREEELELVGRVERLEGELKTLLLPNDPNDEKNVLLEIRAGTGGDEATLFAQELYRMYNRYAERHGWKTEILTHHATGLGGVKEVIVQISGERVYSRLKFESGVHRVQRVPETEASGRIHTSAVTVAVLPEAEDVEIEIDEGKDLRIDTFCSSGPGGQSVNTTYSAIRITHLPSGLVVSQQDEKSWHKNKAKALKVLRSRLYDIKMREQQDAIAKERRGQIGSGDRSEKIRTYNFPQNRVSDHRIGLTLHRLDAVMEGDLDEILDALQTHDQAERLKEEVKA